MTLWNIVAGWHGFWQFVFLVFLVIAAENLLINTIRLFVAFFQGWPPEERE